MTKALMIASPTAAIDNGRECNLFGWSSDTITESWTQARATEGATFSNLRANIISGGSGTNNFQFRDAGANGSQLATRAGAGVCEDASNTDTLSAGDLFNIAYTDTGTDSTISWLAGNIELASGYGAIHGSAAFNGANHDLASTTRFPGYAGGLVGDGEATEPLAACKVYGYDTFEAFQVHTAANARTTDAVFKTRINGADGSGIITYTAGTFGLQYDDGLAEAITAGHTIACSLTLGTGVEDMPVTFFAATLKSSITKQDVWLKANLERAASATPSYLPIGGGPNSLTAFTEAQARCKVGYAGTASHLGCYLSVNTYTVSGTLKLMLNGTAVITTPITLLGGAAWYENTSDTVSFDDDDELSYEFDGGTSGSITIRVVRVTLAPTVAAAGSVGHRVIGGGWGGRTIGA